MAILAASVFMIAQTFSLPSTKAPAKLSSEFSGTQLQLSSPVPNSIISSPLQISGKAPGLWFFEAVFGVVLTNWDGLIIAEGYVEALDAWMTDEMVRFEGQLRFNIPYPQAQNVPDFMKRGVLILRKANPSGLPEHDDAVEMWVRFE